MIEPASRRAAACGPLGARGGVPELAAGWVRSCRIVLAVLIAVPGPSVSVEAATGRFQLSIVDRDTGQPIACRMHLWNAAGRPRKPNDRTIPFWHDHFVVPGQITLKLPLGQYTFELERGPEYLRRSGYFLIQQFADDSKQESMRRFVDMASLGWYSGDLDVRRPQREIPLLIEAEDLHIVPVLTRPLDPNRPNPASAAAGPLVRVAPTRFYHRRNSIYHGPGGELLLLNLTRPIDLAQAGGEYPPPDRFIGQVRSQPGAWIDLSRPFWWDLPALVAHHQVDSIQIAHRQLCRDQVISHETGGKPRDRLRYPDPWGNAQWSQAIYFHLLDCGLRIPPSAGSGSGESPNPVGYNRMYVHVGGDFSYPKWWENLRAGRVIVTNGPLIRPTVRGQLPGYVFEGRGGQALELQIGLTLSTREPISYLEIIKNGQVEHSIRFEEYAESGRLPTIQFRQSGWFLIRAVTDAPKTYRFAMTGPYYVEFDGKPRISRRSAQFFLDWVYQRARQIHLTDPSQHRQVIPYHREARDFWQDLVDRANAE